MAQIALDHADSEAVVSAYGTIQNLTLDTVPPNYENDYFTLADDNGTIVNMHIGTSHVSAGSALISNASIPYTNLKVLNFPTGAVLQLEYEETEAPEQHEEEKTEEE